MVMKVRVILEEGNFLNICDCHRLRKMLFNGFSYHPNFLWSMNNDLSKLTLKNTWEY